jgi:uncharacterized membrane protein
MIMDKANLQLNPSSMTPTEIAKLLSAVSAQQVSISMIEDAIHAGVPVSASGHVNLIELIAWLEHEYHEAR